MTKVYEPFPQPLTPDKRQQEPVFKTNITDYPILMRVEHVAEILNVSKRVAYEIMDEKGFPLIRIRRSKRVNREDFFEWLRVLRDENER